MALTYLLNDPATPPTVGRVVLEDHAIYVYTQNMLVITWDEPKRLKTLRERGLDFADLAEGFFAASLVVPAKQGRLMAIGPMLDGVITVVFIALGAEGISIISMRPASQKERKLYAETQIA